MATDLDVFFSDDLIATVATIGGVPVRGILDQPDELVADGRLISSEYLFLCRTSQVSALQPFEIVTLSGVNYEARRIQKIDDGSLTRILLGRPS